MAHKGKKYKLQFRRDLTLNRLQTLGSGEAYDLRFEIFRNTSPPSVLQYALRGINLDRSANPTRVWESSFTLVGSHFWKFRCTQVNFWQYPQSQQIWEIEDSLAGLIFRHSPVNQSADANYGSWGFSDPSPFDFWKPPFPTLVIQVRCNAVLLGYADYNP